MILTLPFAGLHRFSGQRHAENFVRYLFSRSKGHPVGPRTALNLLTEVAADGAIARRYRNTDPGAACARFLRERVPANAAERLADHGAYVLFAVPVPGGRVVSNVLPSGRQPDGFVGDPVLIREAAARVGGMGTLTRLALDSARAGPVVAFDEASLEEHEAADSAVHDALIAALAPHSRPLLLASHHDQREAPANWHANPFYHVHWLMEAP